MKKKCFQILFTIIGITFVAGFVALKDEKKITKIKKDPVQIQLTEKQRKQITAASVLITSLILMTCCRKKKESRDFLLDSGIVEVFRKDLKSNKRVHESYIHAPKVDIDPITKEDLIDVFESIPKDLRPKGFYIYAS